MTDRETAPPALSPAEHEQALKLQDARERELRKPADRDPNENDQVLPKVRSDEAE